jgi:molybdopterin molybdotransferase
MLEFEQARQLILDAATPLGSELVALDDADGRVLAEDVVSSVDLPPFDYSAMDGYALAGALAGPEPWRLSVAFEQAAGSAPGNLRAGDAARIFTGAPLPHGADRVVMQEDTQREGSTVIFRAAVPAGSNVRRSGEDLARGDVALERGARLNAFSLGLLAALDRPVCRVSLRPRVALLCTGNELRDAGSTARAGSIPDSNGPSLAALARRAGAQVNRLPRSADDLEGTRKAVRSALAECDVLLTVGGVSVGDHDVVKAALEAEGVRLDFWKVKIKPGKPLAFGRRGSTLVLGLPGNPVSAQLTLCLFGLPLLRALQGDARPLPQPLTVRLAAGITQRPGRLVFYRAELRGNVARVLPNQSSGSPTSMARADALIMVPPESSGVAAGAEAEALRLDEL